MGFCGIKVTGREQPRKAAPRRKAGWPWGRRTCPHGRRRPRPQRQAGHREARRALHEKNGSDAEASGETSGDGDAAGRWGRWGSSPGAEGRSSRGPGWALRPPRATPEATLLGTLAGPGSGGSWLRRALCQRPAGRLGCPTLWGSCGDEAGSEAKDPMSPSVIWGSLY